MKLLLSLSALLLSLLLFIQPAISQTKQQLKAEKELVQYLNTICKTHTANQLSIDMGNIVHPYDIKDGILSVVRKYKMQDDSSIVFIRTSVAISNIEAVFYDYYVGFEAANKSSVTEERAINPNGTFEKAGSTELMHVAPIDNSDEGPAVQEKLMQLVNNVKAIYNKSR